MFEWRSDFLPTRVCQAYVSHPSENQKKKNKKKFSQESGVVLYRDTLHELFLFLLSCHHPARLSHAPL